MGQDADSHTLLVARNASADMRNPRFHLRPVPSVRGCALAVLLTSWSMLSSDRTQAQSAVDGVAASTPASGHTAGAGKLAAMPRPLSSMAKPLWSELSAAQREALAPLSTHWDALSASQKRKWIALSKNYAELSVSEQALLHARMGDWVKLSPQQRRTARLNFAETKRLSAGEKHEKWEAYQALSPDARHKLTESAPAAASGAAVAVRPVPAQKLANVPTAASNAATRPKLAAPNQINPHTLLPEHAQGVRSDAVKP